MRGTNRITHSPAGFLRSMQMSRYPLWIMAEGPLDQCFYSNICEARSRQTHIPYKIALAHELPGFSGDGKEALLLIYKRLRRRDKLTSTFKGKKTVVLFFVDKDTDDLRRRMVRSEHVTYTEHYCVENYLFRFGDLVGAMASCALLDLQVAAKQIRGGNIQWARRAAENWRDWVTHCVLVTRLRIRNVPNYGPGRSLVHPGPYSAPDTAKQSELARLMMRNGRLSSRELDAASRRAEAYVSSVYQKDEQDRIFNGKWYAKFIAEDARRAAAPRRLRRMPREEVFARALILTLDFRGSWSRRFHDAFAKGVTWLQG